MNVSSIRELKKGAGAASIEGVLWLQVESAAMKQTKQGKDYCELIFTDGMESLVLRVWSDHAMYAHAIGIKAPEFLELCGTWVDNGTYGLEALKWTSRRLAEDELTTFLNGPKELREKQAADYSFIETTLNETKDPRLRTLGLRFLEEFGERFRRTAAAREYHHARRGGLVEHVAQMMRSAISLSEVYNSVNRDLLVLGVLFHDSGKLWENCYQKHGFIMPYHDIAELVSHIPLGIEIVNRLWKDLTDQAENEHWKSMTPASEDVRLHLLHLIASHHGTLEFGSPVPPKTPEAVLLHFVDNIDAKMEMLAEGYEKSPLVGKNIHERVRPMYHRLVSPLPCYSPAENANQEEA